MADLPEDLEVRTAIETAEIFVNNYYPTLNKPNGARELHWFYVKNNPASPLKPDISLNGNVITDTGDVEAVFEKLPAKTHYEVQSFDCHTLNANYNVGAPDDSLDLNKSGRKMSILVMVSGSVRYGDGGETHGFYRQCGVGAKLGGPQQKRERRKEMANSESNLEGRTLKRK